MVRIGFSAGSFSVGHPGSVAGKIGHGAEDVDVDEIISETDKYEGWTVRNSV